MYCWKILVISTLLPSVLHGFVTPLTTSGGSGPSHKARSKASSAGAGTEPANWALIFDCDGVILEVCRYVIHGVLLSRYFSPDSTKGKSVIKASLDEKNYARVQVRTFDMCVFNGLLLS